MWATETDPRAENSRSRHPICCNNTVWLRGGASARGSGMDQVHSGSSRRSLPESLRVHTQAYAVLLNDSDGRRLRPGPQAHRSQVKGMETQQSVCTHHVHSSPLKGNRNTSRSGVRTAPLHLLRSGYATRSVRPWLKIATNRADTQRGGLSGAARYGRPLLVSDCNGCISISGASQ